MSKTITQLLTGKRTGWAIVNEKGKCLEKFKLKTTATQWMPKIEKLNTDQKLKVIEITD